MVVLILITLGALCVWNEKIKTRRAKYDILKARWQMARDARLYWKQDHPYHSFRNPEYQALFIEELNRAEIIYMFFGPREQISSYQEYDHEAKASETS